MAGTTLCVLCVRGARPFLPMPCVTAFRPACRSFHFDNKGLFKSILPPPMKNQGVRGKFVTTHNSMGFFQGTLTKETPHSKKTSPQGNILRGFNQVGDYLFSRAVSSELSWARVSLTSVFGMGTGGTSPSSSPTNMTDTVYHISVYLSSVFEGRAFKTE